MAAQAILLAGDAAQKSHWLPLLAGGTVAALALTEAHGDWDLANLTCTAEGKGDAIVLSGGKTFVTDAAMADVLLVTVALDGAPALVLVETANLPAGAMRREVVIDETRRSYGLNLEGLSVPRANLLTGGDIAGCLKNLHLAACLLYAAEMCGGTAGVINVTLEYLTTRRQFDHFIGAYQALKSFGRENDVLIVSVDGGCPGVQNIADGVIGATSQQYPLRMAALGVEAIAAYAADGSLPENTPGKDFYDTGVALVTDKAVDGVDSISVAEGTDLCWG